MPRLYLICSVLAAMLISSFPAEAARKKRERKPKPPVNVVFHKSNLDLYLNGGYIVGEAGDIIDDVEDNFGNHVLYGVGGSFDYFTSEKTAWAFSLEIDWKEIPKDSLPAIRGLNYGVSFSYYLNELKKTRYYIRSELGRISATLPEYPQSGTKKDLDLGTYTYFKIGLGIFSYSRSFTHAKTEFYYKTIFSDGHELEIYPRGELDLNVGYLGLVMAIGIGL